MACCVIAAFLVAQFVAMLRRWGIFWGVVRPRGYESSANFFGWLRERLASSAARRRLAIAFALEIGIAGGWLYTAHGAHVYRLADQVVARIQGKRVIYIGLCTPKGDERFVRLAFDPPTTRRSL